MTGSRLIASALLAGVLARFGIQAFAAAQTALPLVLLILAIYLLGKAAIRAAGYGPDAPDGGIPVSKVITLTGLATLVLAPFGAFALNLSAITAAICMGPEAHEDPRKRYTAAVTGLLTAFPKELVVAIAGLALLGTIGSGLAQAVREEAHREAALITFLVTLSGVVIAGVGSAFWGVAAGALALFVQQYRQRTA